MVSQLISHVIRWSKLVYFKNKLLQSGWSVNSVLIMNYFGLLSEVNCYPPPPTFCVENYIFHESKITYIR